MKLAHLILCHKEPEQVKRLASRLTHPDQHFYIHVDKKADIVPFRELTVLPNVFLIEKRVSTHWAGYSIVRATINSFKQILASGHQYSHVNLLSGQDYPLKSGNEISDFFFSNQGKAFVIAKPFTGNRREIFERITTYHFVHLAFRGRYTIERLANALLPKRVFPDSFIPVGRSQWMTLPVECIPYVLDFFQKAPAITRLFRYMWAPDEIIFQSILYNSHFRENIVNDNLRYADWSQKQPSPKILTMEDAPALTASDKMFARKFDPVVDSKILDYLDGIIEQKAYIHQTKRQ